MRTMTRPLTRIIWWLSLALMVACPYWPLEIIGLVVCCLIIHYEDE